MPEWTPFNDKALKQLSNKLRQELKAAELNGELTTEQLTRWSALVALIRHLRTSSED